VTGTTLAHYRITAKLGEGGMGEVYRATDIRLGREVAIKVLPAEMAASQERLERFQREAQALAALDHPNIVHVYSVESAEWAGTGAGSEASPMRVHFMTMQLIDGEPLDSLVREGGFGIGRIIEIGTAIAEALAAAHEKGIVHRDLKPANVMVTGQGRVKVLDFGLAKIAAPESDTPLGTEMPTALVTREGIVMGTVPYMPPEQVTGRALDSRTDIFSLGVLLYEMVAGQRPFAGRSSTELASAILRDRPEPLAGRRSDLPPGLARVIERGRRCYGDLDPGLEWCPHRGLRRCANRGGFLGRGAAVPAQWSRRRCRDPGRRTDRRRRDRPGTLLLPEGRLSQLVVALRGRCRRANGRPRARRTLRDEREPT
jgi:serine/threonine-protein kinase